MLVRFGDKLSHGCFVKKITAIASSNIYCNITINTKFIVILDSTGINIYIERKQLLMEACDEKIQEGFLSHKLIVKIVQHTKLDIRERIISVNIFQDRSIDPS